MLLNDDVDPPADIDQVLLATARRRAASERERRMSESAEETAHDQRDAIDAHHMRVLWASQQVRTAKSECPASGYLTCSGHGGPTANLLLIGESDVVATCRWHDLNLPTYVEQIPAPPGRPRVAGMFLLGPEPKTKWRGIGNISPLAVYLSAVELNGSEIERFSDIRKAFSAFVRHAS